MKIIDAIKRYITRRNLRKVLPPIKTADIMKFAFKTRPMIALEAHNAVGRLFEVDMRSGKFASYKCVKYEPAWNVDWGWYYLEFWEYAGKEE